MNIYVCGHDCYIIIISKTCNMHGRMFEGECMCVCGRSHCSRLWRRSHQMRHRPASVPTHEVPTEHCSLVSGRGNNYNPST